VTYGAMARRPLTVPNGLLIFKDLQLRGLWVTKWIEGVPRPELDEVYGNLAGLMHAGELAVPVAATLPLADFEKALERAQDSARDGKILFVP
jgi:trans-2-enoyl-CoA reductase